MTVPLSPTSPRRVAAAAFAAELRRAMAARKVSTKRLAEAIGTGTSAVALYRAGDNLPRTDTAARLAEALDWPKLVGIARAGRALACGRCGRTFVNEGGGPKIYCSAECREVATMLRSRPATGGLYDTVMSELGRVHGTTQPVSRRTLTRAAAEYRRSESKRQTRSRTTERRLLTIQAAVDAMCAGCEPLGVCRTADCALRAVSPLPLALDGSKTGDVPRPALGPHHPSYRDVWLASVQAANERRWSRPGERERQGAQTRARYAAETPEERQHRIESISAARRAGIERRRTA